MRFGFFSENGGGSGGRISIYLSEYMLFNGNLVATGGNAVHKGGPGTVYVQTDVGDDSWKELWIDNLNRGDVNSCDYPTDIDNVKLNDIHLENKACAVPTVVSQIFKLWLNFSFIKCANIFNISYLFV
jgi:hypothetical protein